MIYDKNNLDGRPDCAPSHWNEHFQIYYLTEKMRSQGDPYFSSLCDRVARGTVNAEDQKYLRSRIQATESEQHNENFKNGKLSIIVTVNKKRNLINSQKLEKLLPTEKEYFCNSIDRVKNLPGKQTIPHKLKENPGKTGNLSSELKLKIGAPVVITTNHHNKKYKDDGIMNGARGFVQSIQVSKDNIEKVDIIWVVFNNESVGRLYRYDYRHLRKSFEPGHELATPILPQRRNFTLNFGNVEYQRTNFPLSLAYALTAHKCQGETLDEVIIDFGPDKLNKISNFVLPGSFYVALTRVKLGCKVFLKSFEESYIKVNKSIEEKVSAMRKFRNYSFKKIYLDEDIFEVRDSEIKTGYLNINGLMEGGHAEYLNEDFNLRCLDFLILAETKLDGTCKSDQVKATLSNWLIIGRFDANDGSKHMGLMLLASKQSQIVDQFKSVSHHRISRDNKLQVQGLVIQFETGPIIGFIYCRSTPSLSEVSVINRQFDICNILMGDFNLSHRLVEDQQKIEMLCSHKRINSLQEITRSLSNNQLDYIFIDEQFKNNYFVTSYYNFISDHKTIVSRVGLNNNKLTQEIKERLTFDKDSHLKQSLSQDHSTIYAPKHKTLSESSEESRSTSSNEDPQQAILEEEQTATLFNRRFENPDMTTCWLNACSQLILTAMSFDEYTTKHSFTSELGRELLRLFSMSGKESLDPSQLKEIIIATEDTRIASRLSEISYQVINQSLMEEQSAQIRDMRLDMGNGQQCVRDFFICINQNLESWPDVFATFSFSTRNTSECSACHKRNAYETNQIYIELDVPPNNSILKDYVEDYFNTQSNFHSYCDGECKKLSDKITWTSLIRSDEAKFLIVILSRGIQTLDGFTFVKNKIDSTRNIQIR